ncbi:hypothetical protein PRZ48_000928 [Zasmidium cellare]|uniref:PAC domain-containing protein n=1 Tax=Zasmidium cellare TaxID=395010 RepID=A0ABR0F1H5_ZASCE|nr:hypothetical protein PRZ48_000928 [Zasmidium cellare]
MSSLRVVNVSPNLEASWTETPLSPSQQQRDDILSSPALSTPLEVIDEPFYSHFGEHMSAIASPAPPSVFDIPEEQEQHDETHTEPTTALDSGRESDDQDSYNLKPPPPPSVNQNQNGLEELATRFLSAEHLDVILADYALALRFTRFLDQYRPHHTDALKQYAQARKAIAAVEYANAIARQLQTQPGRRPIAAATLDQQFEARSKQTVESLVEEALPAYLTHRLVSLVTDTLVKEITGNSAPIMHELIPSLAEVYCISDPSMPDNPIVYASEEFYNISQYNKDYVIGRNCRFLQGPKTSHSAVRRLIETLSQGEECCETILNYRRDGTPFMNLLMIAPLYDNKGSVRYFLGAQIDVSSLIEDGRGLESFAQLLSHDRFNVRFSRPTDKDPQKALETLSQLLTDEEADTLRNRAHRTSLLSHQPPASIRSTSTRPPTSRNRSSRLVLGMDEQLKDPPLWPSAALGSSGRLPGVYQNYLLVRPYPSLRITFTSPTLRIPGLLQTKLLDRIGGPSTVREGLQDALARGTTGVTAKVTWLTASNESEGKPRWLHCTPLFGSDDRVGVWMVVMVENEMVTGGLSRGEGSANGRLSGAGRLTSSKLYADYLKREGGRPVTSESTRERREADEFFRDF